MVWCANASLPEGVENCDLLGTIKGSSYSCISLAAYNAASKSLTFIYNGCHLFQTSMKECNKPDCYINVEENSKGNYCCCDTYMCNQNATAANVEVNDHIYLPAPIRYESVNGFTRTAQLIGHDDQYNPLLFIILAILSITIFAFVAFILIQKRIKTSRKIGVLTVDGIQAGVADEARFSDEYKNHRNNTSDI